MVMLSSPTFSTPLSRISFAFCLHRTDAAAMDAAGDGCGSDGFQRCEHCAELVFAVFLIRIMQVACECLCSDNYKRACIGWQEP